jgi:outer membrane immunogenic protein
MTKTLLAGAALAAFLAGPALAADLPVRAPVMKAPPAPVVAVYNWTGFYIGGHAGFGWAETDYNFNDFGFWNNTPGDSFTQKGDGFLGGGHVGFNWQTGQFVWGLEGSYTWSDVKSGIDPSPFFPATDSFDTRLRWLATITPRFGIANDNWLFYVKGGVAFTEVRSRIFDNTPPPFESFKKDTRVGWTVGGGVEWGITQNWIIGVEGNYYDFGSFNVNQVVDTSTGLPAGVTTNHDVDTTMFSVLGRVSYKFGGPIVGRY